MRKMWPVLVLMLALPLSLGSKVESGCNDWDQDPSSANNVCCSRCKPGNRLVTRCGLDPKTLCTPCENGTYVTDGSQRICRRCRECTDLMRVKEPCTASTDTKCDCVEGYRCGNDQCSYCIKECGKGQEPTERDCQPCPEGTFNDKIHNFCVKWSGGCPSRDQKIVSKGTAFSDIVCDPAEAEPTRKPLEAEPTRKPLEAEPTRTPLHKEYSSWTTLVIVIICASLIVPLIIAISGKRREMQKVAPDSEEAPDGERQTPEPEQCSFCFPQEEHGSSSEVSLMSDDKPFELVV